jgi:hypothetical protein
LFEGGKNMGKIKFAAGFILLFLGQAYAQDRVDVSTYSFAHDYKTGEKFSYLFEDTEYTYSAALNDGFYTVGDFKYAQELHVRVDESIVEEKGEKRKKFEISDVSYRKVDNDKGGLTQPALEPITKLVPGFPATISYTCKLDEADFLQAILKVYQPYMPDPLGMFLYYKLMDVHTFTATVSRIKPQTPETFSIKASSDMALHDGTFHNHSPITLFQRIDTVDGARQAYFKIMTMGNYYQMPDSRLDTNYQYSFHVSLDEPYKGLLFDGELQENVFAHKSKAIISRQLSMRRI